MKDRFVRKVLVIGVLVLFVCIGFSSAVAIKGVKQNNNDIINSDIVESAEDLPNLKIMSISAETRLREEMIPFLSTHMRIKNIGEGSVYGLVKIQIDMYNGIGSSSTYFDTIGSDEIKLNLTSGQSAYIELNYYWDLSYSVFYKFVGSVNDDKNVNESNYRDNVAGQKFLRYFSNWGGAWTKIGPIYYPYLTSSLKLGKEPTANSPEIFGNIIVYSVSNGLCLYDLNTNYETPIYKSSRLVQPWNLNENYVLFTDLKDGVYLYKYHNPPDPPVINGPTNGTALEKLTFCTSPIVNSDGDSMSILWDWGDGTTDGWICCYDPGEKICESHRWGDYGTYVIRAKLTDDCGATESDWGELTVTITKDKAVTINSLLLKQLEKYPLLQKIIQRLEL